MLNDTVNVLLFRATNLKKPDQNRSGFFICKQGGVNLIGKMTTKMIRNYIEILVVTFRLKLILAYRLISSFSQTLYPKASY